MNDSRIICFSERNGNEIYVFVNGINYVISRESSGIKGIVHEEESEDSVSSPITGKLLDKKVKNGDNVSQGDVVVILEAMKMEHRLKAPRDGVLSKLTSAVIGGQIKEGELMFELEKE
jgi:biotin carboxyl carrier protein